MWVEGLFSHTKGLKCKMRKPVMGKGGENKGYILLPGNGKLIRTSVPKTQEGDTKVPGYEGIEDRRTNNPMP